MANPFKLCMASAISGTLTYQGKPLSNAKIVREVDKPYRDSFKTFIYQTDEHGQFSVPVVYMYSFLGQFLPMEFVASDRLSVMYEGKLFEFWHAVRRQPNENVEARGKPVNLLCSVDQEVSRIEINSNLVQSYCTWDVEPDPPFDWSDENLFEPAPPKRNE